MKKTSPLQKSFRMLIFQPDNECAQMSTKSRPLTCLKIPGTMGYCSAHTLINQERVKHGCTILRRSVYLDRLCQVHAQAMADMGKLVHSVANSQELQFLVNSDIAGENVERGPSVEAMHKAVVEAGLESAAYRNILGKRFRDFGVGTALGKDEDNNTTLYMVHLFRGHKWETLDSDLQGFLLVPELMDECSNSIEVRLLESPDNGGRRMIAGHEISSTIEGGYGLRTVSSDDESTGSALTQASTEVVLLETTEKRRLRIH